jgi:acid phosphatase
LLFVDAVTDPFPRWTTRTALLLVLMIGVGGCAGTASTTEPSAQPAPATAQAELQHQSLNATLWVQQSAEYDALVHQTYVQAAQQLPALLEDSTLTAAVEQNQQMRVGAYADLPPAVILDVDETVLDNSAYQARLILDGETYDTASWNAWCRERTATAVPGALRFVEHATNAGVAVFYLTNRRNVVRAATRDNLEALGFPVSDDRLIMRGQRAAWSASDKAPRREHIMQSHRIVMQIGDNLGDFLSEVETTLDERERMSATHRGFWGTRWFMLPNPQYGSWEGALFDYDYSLSPEEQLQRKRDRLVPARSEE